MIDCTLYTKFFSPPKTFNFQCFQSADRTCITTILKFILYSQGLFIYIHPPLPKIYKLLAWYFISILHLVAITPLKYCAKLNNKKDILQLIQINTNITYSGSVKPSYFFEHFSKQFTPLNHNTLNINVFTTILSNIWNVCKKGGINKTLKKKFHDISQHI